VAVVIEAALRLRDLLASEGFDCWPKLTGGKGLHLMVPLEPALSHDQVHVYAKQLADRLLPLIASDTRLSQARSGGPEKSSSTICVMDADARQSELGHRAHVQV
jgi:DNA primase